MICMKQVLYFKEPYMLHCENLGFHKLGFIVFNEHL